MNDEQEWFGELVAGESLEKSLIEALRQVMLDHTGCPRPDERCWLAPQLFGLLGAYDESVGESA
jgi:hypothetical protein